MAGVEAVTENISFEIDTWMNGDGEQGVNIAEKVGGADADLIFTNGQILADGATVSGPVTIVWDPVNGSSFTTEGLDTNADFEEVAGSFVGMSNYNFGLSARVGGANETVLIDNLVIKIGFEDDNFRIVSIEKVVVPGDPDTVSVTITWNSEEGKTYGVYASSDMQEDAITDWDEFDDAWPAAVGATTTSYTETGIPLGTERRFYQVTDTTAENK